MRLVRLVALFGLCSALLSSAACTKATVIGTPCLVDKDCNVAGQRCVAGLNGGPTICTHDCTGQTGAGGCPIGFDCTASDPAQPTTLTCNKETYGFDAVTGAALLFGKDCSLQSGATQAEWDMACANSGDPAANPTCHHVADPDSRTTPRAPLRNDAHAYCTGSCSSNSDCPVDMQCAVDYDGKQKCLRRDFCDECVINDNCPGEFNACVPTADGSSRYCSKACGSQYDCGGVQGTYLACSAASDAAGNAAMFCLHKFGACVGSGQICDPCRTQADCANGTSCISNSATGERMCTKACTMDSDCASDKTTTCDFGPPPMTSIDPIHLNLCTGDPMHFNPGVLTCYF